MWLVSRFWGGQNCDQNEMGDRGGVVRLLGKTQTDTMFFPESSDVV